MKSDRGFIQYIKRAYQRTAECGHQVHPLAFSSGKGVHGPVHREIAEAHIVDTFETGDYFLQGLCNSLQFYLLKACAGLRHAARQRTEENESIFCRHVQYVGDGFSGDFYIESLFAEPAAMAFRAGSPSAEAVLHEFVLYLVSLGMDPVEKLVDTYYAFLVAFYAVAVPDGILLLLRQIAIWFKRAYAVTGGDMHEMLGEPPHLVAAPAGDGAVVYAFGLVRDDQIFAYAYYFSKSAADGTCSQRRVETEKIVIRFAEGNSIQFETAAEIFAFQVGNQTDVAAATGECVRNGGEQAGAQIGIAEVGSRIGDLQTVYQQHCIFRIIPVKLQDIFDTHDLSVDKQAGIAVFLQAQHEFDLVAALFPVEICKYVKRPRSILFQPAHYIGRAVLVDFPAADWGIGAAHPCEDQTQEVVYFSRGCNRRTRILDVHLLFYRYRRRYSVDQVHIRFAHSAKKLPGIR